jgi:hypothetical protein
LVTVNEAVGRLPTALAQRESPNASTSSVATPADRVSFQSIAGRSTSPRVGHDEAVLLAGDRDGRNLPCQPSLREGLPHRRSPLARVGLARPSLARDGVRFPADSLDPARVRLHDDDLGALG